MSAKLVRALSSVDWKDNVDAVCKAGDVIAVLHSSISKVAVLAQQIQVLDEGNPALPFVKEMQLAGHDVVRCTALSLYKPAAAALRSMLECALYYSYFRTHPVELKTLVRDKKYYLGKSEIISYCQLHVEGWSRRQADIGLVGRLEEWYSKVSAIVHGQLPGHWRDIVSIEGTRHHPDLLRELCVFVEQCADIIRDFFLCVFLCESWAFVEADAKRELLKGVSASYRSNLKLDKA